MLDLPHPFTPSAFPPADAAVSQAASQAVWHVAVTRAGQFPMSEARCPCDKAPCGLVIPRLNVPCDVHNASALLHQVHAGADCHAGRRSRAARVSAPGRRFLIFRQRRPTP